MVSEQPTRKMVKQLRDAGFLPVRTVGSHTVWQAGSVSVSVPDGHRTISPGVVRQIMAAIKSAQGGK
jgi:predicted RNA binding protein YcfA (HicA-like mRNA interferase family)